MISIAHLKLTELVIRLNSHACLNYVKRDERASNGMPAYNLGVENIKDQLNRQLVRSSYWVVEVWETARFVLQNIYYFRNIWNDLLCNY